MTRSTDLAVCHGSQNVAKRMISRCYPTSRDVRWKPCFSKRLYRERNLIERFFSKLKHFRRVQASGTAATSS